MNVNSPARDTLASQTLDTLRGLAALFVLLGHARNLFLVDYQQLAGPSVSTKAFYFATGLGHECVVMFFVLSGLFIGAGVIQKVSAASWNLTDYLVSRGARLYLVLFPTLLLTLLLDSIGLRWTAPDSIYHGVGSQSVIHDVTERLSPSVLVGNLLFLQTIAVPTFGSNGPLWSLSNEFWYYMLFPCLWIAGTSCFSKGMRLAYAVAFVVIAYFVRSLLPLFPLWLLGAGVSVLPPCRWFERRSFLYAFLGLLLGLCGGVLVACRLKVFPSERVSDYCLAVAASLLVYGLLHLQAPSRTSLSWRVSERLAAMSYTLYLVHMPLLMFVAGVFRSGTRAAPTPMIVAMYMAICSLVIAVAWCFSRCTEVHTAAFRGLIERALFLCGRRAGHSTVSQVFSATDTPVDGLAADPEKELSSRTPTYSESSVERQIT